MSQQIFFYSDWLRENKFSPNFEHLEDVKLAEILRNMYGTVLSKKGTP